MADLYGSSSASLPLESEDLSTFLQQFLHPSSASSACMPFRGPNASSSFANSSVPSGLQNSIGDGRVTHARIGIGASSYVGASSSEINFGEVGGYFGNNNNNNNNNNTGMDEDGSRKGFSFVDGLGMETDFRFDNEDGGAGASGVCTNPVKFKSSSKRSRAAEVHNLSEKRRRSRINEKLKALQKLIPNSDKSDKASMLDEAIEYLKQLQLQVQMLSMRNGVSLHPLCMPGVAEPLHQSGEGTSYGGGHNMLLSMGKDMLTTTSPMGTFPSSQEPAVQPSYEISNHGNSSHQPVRPTLNNIPNSEVAFGFDRSLKAHYKSFNFSCQSKNEGTQLLDAKKS